MPPFIVSLHSGSQHETEHSHSSGQTAPDMVIKVEAKIVNGLLKTITPYHHLVDSCLQDTNTLLAIEDFTLFRTVALQGLNDLTREIACLNCDIPMTLISESQSVRRLHFTHGPGSASNMSQFLEMSSSVGPQANFIDSLRKKSSLVSLRFANTRQPSGNPNQPGSGLPPGYKKYKPILQAYCAKCGNANVRHTADECKGINRGKPSAGPATSALSIPTPTPPGPPKIDG